jgi:deoxyuridine 5'-triphosphate nucleotidohydrolase
MSVPQSSVVTAPPASAGLLIKRLNPAAQLPTRGSALAAGYDMYAAVEKVVPARGKALVSTGISIAVPEGTYGRVAPRSGLASKFSIHTGAGVVDADYRGEVFVLLFNLGDADFKGEYRSCIDDCQIAAVLEVENTVKIGDRLLDCAEGIGKRYATCVV